MIRARTGPEAIRRVCGPVPWSLHLLAGVTFLAFAIIALLPSAIAIGPSIWMDGRLSWSSYASVLVQDRQWTLLYNTLRIAAGSAIVAGILGVPVAFALGYLRIPTRRLLTYALAVPLLVPPYISAIVWVDALGRRGILRFGLDAAQSTDVAPHFGLYTVAGVIAVLGLSYFPIVAFSVAAALRRYDPRIEDPALLTCGRARVFRSIVVPLLVPSIVSGCLVVFVLALIEFAVPSLLQVNVYAVEIYSRFSVSYEASQAAAQATPLIACGMGALICWIAYVRPRQRRLAGGSMRARAAGPYGIAAYTSAAACWGLTGVAGFLPLALLMRQSLPLTTYLDVWKSAREEIGASLVLAAISATLLTALALSMAYLVRARRPFTRVFDLSLLPLLISGPLLGIGLILLWNRQPIAWVYDSPAVLILAYMARFLFPAYLVLRAALLDLSPRIEEAAQVAGVSWWRQATGLLLPLVSPAVVAVWGLGFVFSLRELDAAVLVAPPGWNPLAVRLFGLLHYGPGRFVAALSVTTALLILGVAAFTAILFTRLRQTIDARH